MGSRGPEIDKIPMSRYDEWMTSPRFFPKKKEGDYVFSPEYDPEQLRENTAKWLVLSGFEADLVTQFVADSSGFFRTTITNMSRTTHTYTSYFGLFDIGMVEPGQTVKMPPLRGGFFHPYYCRLHKEHYNTAIASETGIWIVYPGPLK